MRNKIINNWENDPKMKQNPFKTPEGYFEGLTDQIMATLPDLEEAPKTKKVVSISQRITPWLYMAAMFVGLGLFVKFIMPGHSDSAQVVMNEETNSSVKGQSSDADYLDYLETRYEEILIADNLSEI